MSGGREHLFYSKATIPWIIYFGTEEHIILEYTSACHSSYRKCLCPSTFLPGEDARRCMNCCNHRDI